jgi:cell division protein FtsB
MRARTREVNIFNMSLLDILCGALGAFCFMMLVLLPYYKPAATRDDLRQQEATTDDLLKQLEKLKEDAKDSALAKQLNDLVDQLQTQIKQLQGEVNRYSSENDQLKEENKNLTATNTEQRKKLDMRNPFLVMVGSSPEQDIDVYLVSDTVGENTKSTNPPFDLVKPHNDEFWAGDTVTWWPQHGVTVWLTRDAPAGAHFKVYVKLADAANRVAATLTGNVKTPNANIAFPAVPLTAARFWTLMGIISVDNDNAISFSAATDAERDAEWSKLTGTRPPPMTAVTPPGQRSTSPTTQPTPASELSKEEIDRRTREYIKRRLQPNTSPAASPGISP